MKKLWLLGTALGMLWGTATATAADRTGTATATAADDHIHKIDGHRILLATVDEMRHGVGEDLTKKRAMTICQAVGKRLRDYEYEELDWESDWTGEKTREIRDWRIVEEDRSLRQVKWEDVEKGYHRGGATVAVLTLALVPIIIPYRARVMKEVTCVDMDAVWNVE